MKRRVRVPIRLKILLSVLFVVTAVVSVITFTMANLFHEDKTTYIKDLASMVSQSAAEETRSLLTGYGERLEIYARIASDDGIAQKSKATLLEGLFQDFPELVGVTLYNGEKEIASAFDESSLEPLGLTRDDLLREADRSPLPLEEIREGSIYVRNSSPTDSLPLMTVALAPESPSGEVGENVVSAFLRLDSLQRIAERFRVFEVALYDAEGVLLAHRDTLRVARRESASSFSAEATMSDERTLGGTVEYVRDDVPMLLGQVRADIGSVMATAQIPKSAAYLASRDLLKRLLAVALVLLALAAAVSLAWARRLTRPIERLSDATRELAQGRFEVRVSAKSRDEIGELATSFNQMASDLNEAQDQLVQSAKLAAFGQLGAGIAHEVKNPLAGILGCAQLSLRKAEAGSFLHKNLTLIEKETKRCETIIKSLLKFARQEKAAMRPTDVNPAIEDAVAIVNHQMEISHVRIKGIFAKDLPQVQGNANQLQQVIINLIMNAQQAMEGEAGRLQVSTQHMGSEIEIRVRDDGPGMSPEVRSKVFDPFFTTKPSGIGTGLGLSVSFGIIEDHGGRIAVETELGVGTEFIVTLPVLEEQPIVLHELGQALDQATTPRA